MTRADTLLLIALAASIGYLFARFWQPTGDAHWVQISSAAGVQRVSLSSDQMIEVEGPLGVSQLSIDDQAIRFVASPCRHQVCVRSGWHRRGGAVTACVPNRVSVTLQGGERDLDATSY